jgi:hypothetical protein
MGQPFGFGGFGLGAFGFGVTDISIPFPDLPVEGLWTEAELTFRDDEPRRLFPENQDSNWGLLRKNFSDVMADIHTKLALIWNEMFPQTATTFLDEWERVAGLPRNPAGKTLAQRRSSVLARLQQGPFTRTRRNNVIDNFITATFGEAIKLLPEGVALTGDGVPIYNDVPPGEYFRVLEYVEDFYYEIQILSTISGVDEAGLANSLNFIQYGGLRWRLVYVDSFSLYGFGVERALPLTIT